MAALLAVRMFLVVAFAVVVAATGMGAVVATRILKVAAGLRRDQAAKLKEIVVWLRQVGHQWRRCSRIRLRQLLLVR